MYLQTELIVPANRFIQRSKDGEQFTQFSPTGPVIFLSSDESLLLILQGFLENFFFPKYWNFHNKSLAPNNLIPKESFVSDARRSQGGP